jgi:hypothetical protein
LAQIILEGREFTFVQRKGITLLQRKIIAKELKYIENFQFILGCREFKFVQIKGRVLFKGGRGIITKM